MTVLGPNALTVVLLLILVAALGIGVSYTEGTFSIDSNEEPAVRDCFGPGPWMVAHQRSKEAFRVHINWHWLLPSVVVLYLFSSLLSPGIRKHLSLSRPSLIGILSVVVVLGGAYAASMLWCKLYWGYCFRRPPLDPMVDTFTKVRALSSLDTRSDSSFKGGRYDIQDALPQAEKLLPGGTRHRGPQPKGETISPAPAASREGDPTALELGAGHGTAGQRQSRL